MSAPALIKREDLERIFAAAKATDYPVRIEIEPGTRKVVIIPAKPVESTGANPWDDA